MKSTKKINKLMGFLKFTLPLIIVFPLFINAQEADEEMVVSGSFIPDAKRNTSEISAILDSSDIERAGDDNIAIALTRLAGLSLVRGKYVFVRGLGDRYSSASLNGLNLPSPEPLKRVVPLDLFPTSIIGSSVVQKTYSADMPGEFGGGMVEIKTKAVPLDRIFEFSASAGFNSATSLKNDGLMYDGGEDNFGYDDGVRSVPSSIQDAINNNLKLDRSNFNSTQLANFGRDFENSKLWVLQSGEVPLDQSYSLTYGDSFDGLGIDQIIGIPSATMGFMVTGGYKNSWDTQEGIRQTGDLQNQGDGTVNVVVQNDKTFRSTTNDITAYAMAVLGVETDLSELKYTGLYIHKGSKEARILQGYDSSDSANVREDFLEFYERELTNHQLNFNKTFENDWNLNVGLGDGEAERDSPYERVAFYEDGNNDGVYLYDVNTGRNQTQFSMVEDQTTNVVIDLEIPFGSSSFLRAGVESLENDRSAEVRSYRFLDAGGSIPLTGLDNRIDYIFADQNFDPNRLLVIENTASSSPAGYLGLLEVDSAYISVESEIGDNFEITAGIRHEDGLQQVNTYDLFTGVDSTIDKSIEEDYLLPSLTLTYLPEFDENLQIRLGLSQTIARPSFRELSPTLFLDVDTDRVIAGSLYLQNSEIDNIDLRAEYYFGLNQFLTAGIFYKEILNPIEETVNESGDLIITSYQNVPMAEITGFEIEYEQIFEAIMDSSNDLIVKFNYTDTESEVIVNPGDTYINTLGTSVNAQNLLANGRDTRLQGQSDTIANFQLGLDNLQDQSEATLIFNYVSDRVRARGIDVLPDIVEEPPLLVDFTYSRVLDYPNYDLKLSLELRNLLDEEYFASMNNIAIYDQYDLGQSASLGFKVSFK
ncbi:MAG: TonB-dependent receptor plug domain-containing protein [Gammaproteobacteria bacterium]